MEHFMDLSPREMAEARTLELRSRIEEISESLQPLYAAICKEDAGGAGSILLDLSGAVGDLRLTAYRICRLLDDLTDGTPQA